MISGGASRMADNKNEILKNASEIARIIFPRAATFVKVAGMKTAGQEMNGKQFRFF